MRKSSYLILLSFFLLLPIMIVPFCKCETGYYSNTIEYNFISLAENQAYIGLTNSSATWYYDSDLFTLEFPKPTYFSGYYISSAILSNFTWYNYVYTNQASCSARIEKVDTTTPLELTTSNNRMGNWINNDSEYTISTHFQQTDKYYFITLDVLVYSIVDNKDVKIQLLFDLEWNLEYSESVVTSLISSILPIITPLIIALAIPLVLAMQYKRLGFGIGCLIGGIIFMLSNSLSTIICIIELILGVVLLATYKKNESE